jgi:hypothetical protein
MSRFGIGLAITLLANELLLAGPHPHYDDGGAVNWKPSWPAALQAAKSTGKPIFIDAGIEN